MRLKLIATIITAFAGFLLSEVSGQIVSSPTADQHATQHAAEVSERESLFPEASRSLAFSHFTWGADVGASIDMRGYDLSTFDLDLVLGYKNKWLRTLGVGAGIHRSFGNGNNLIPVYLLVRTSFRPQPSRFFLNLKVGYSFNTIADTETTAGTNVSIGCGINLAMSKRFASHIILSYGYYRFSEAQQIAANMKVNHTDEAQIRFGVNF